MAHAEIDQLTAPAKRPTTSFEVTAITAILALALAILAGAGAALYQRSRPTHYVSAATLLIDQPIAVAQAPDDGPLLKLQQLRYYYASLLSTEVIAGPVASKLGLPAAVVETSVSAAINPTSFTITIVATAPSSAQAERVASASAGQLVSYVAKSQDRIGVAAVNQVVLDEVSTPSPGLRTTVSSHKIVLSGVVAFIVVGAAFLIVADLLRRRW